jgi:hypothetical protein
MRTLETPPNHPPGARYAYHTSPMNRRPIREPEHQPQYTAAATRTRLSTRAQRRPSSPRRRPRRVCHPPSGLAHLATASAAEPDAGHHAGCAPGADQRDQRPPAPLRRDAWQPADRHRPRQRAPSGDSSPTWARLRLGCRSMSAPTARPPSRSRGSPPWPISVPTSSPRRLRPQRRLPRAVPHRPRPPPLLRTVHRPLTPTVTTTAQGQPTSSGPPSPRVCALCRGPVQSSAYGGVRLPQHGGRSARPAGCRP